jgi:hypothetical protein
MWDVGTHNGLSFLAFKRSVATDNHLYPCVRLGQRGLVPISKRLGTLLWEGNETTLLGLQTTMSTQLSILLLQPPLVFFLFINKMTERKG